MSTLTGAARHDLIPSLPPELLELLNQAYFLYRLALEPEQVVPPGKSLLSMVTQARIRHNEAQLSERKQESLHDRVSDVAHEAFWSEASESLSSPLPSVQLSRLKLLHVDMLESLSPLFPPGNQLIRSLASPIPPTSSPLHSALVLFREILTALRERCAPSRDGTIDSILDTLNQPISEVSKQPDPSVGVSKPVMPLAKLVVETIKSIISLADSMKSDFSLFVLGSMPESQLKQIVVGEAKLSEKTVVLKIWGSEVREATRALRNLWDTWLVDTKMLISQTAQNVEEQTWISSLMQALRSQLPVTCPLPISLSQTPVKGQSTPANDVAWTSGNILPPQFFLCAPRLLEIQNELQAIVIAASLRPLARLPPNTPSTDSQSGNDFMERILSLLREEIHHSTRMHVEKDANEGETTVINLADEVVRARRLFSLTEVVNTAEEQAVRISVDRILRPQDPVFVLLQQRLIAALEQALVQDISESAMPNIPLKMQAGRLRSQEAVTMSLTPPRAEGDAALEFLQAISRRPVIPIIKGYEHLLLTKAVEEVAQKIHKYTTWVSFVWRDLA